MVTIKCHNCSNIKTCHTCDDEGYIFSGIIVTNGNNSTKLASPVKISYTDSSVTIASYDNQNVTINVVDTKYSNVSEIIDYLNKCQNCSYHSFLKKDRVVYHEEYFASSENGTTQGGARNMSITRNSTGFWTAILNTPHADGVNYHVSLTAEEQANFRDGMDIHVVQGTKTANGFDFMITAGDNGARADGYVDTPFTLSINAPITI